jgi:amidase
LEICFLTATELVRLVRAKELSALEVMEAQIERVNPEVNAIVTLTAERAMDHAFEEATRHAERRPPVAG